jgi:hypothetical protein
MNERSEVTYEKFGESHTGAWRENDTGPGWSFLVPADDPAVHFQAGTILKKFVVATIREYASVWWRPESKPEKTEPVTVEFVEADEWDEGLFRIQLAPNPTLCDECGEHTADRGRRCGWCEDTDQPEDFTEGWKHSD